MAGDPAFTDWLKQRRKALDLTQAELAFKVGCSIYTVQKIEVGGARPSRHLAELLAAALEIAVEDRPAFVQGARNLGPGLNRHRAATRPAHPQTVMRGRPPRNW
jgi:transcriptional regulator with XRE-family HTH domain